MSFEIITLMHTMPKPTASLMLNAQCSQKLCVSHTVKMDAGNRLSVTSWCIQQRLMLSQWTASKLKLYYLANEDRCTSLYICIFKHCFLLLDITMPNCSVVAVLTYGRMTHVTTMLRRKSSYLQLSHWHVRKLYYLLPPDCWLSSTLDLNFWDKRHF